MVAVLAMLMLMLMVVMLLLRGHCRRCCLDSCNTFTLSIMIVNQLDDDVAAAAAVVVAAVVAGLVVGSINVEVISSCRNTDFIIREMSRLMRSSSPNVWREFLVPFTTTVP
jgi:hypothetical protein